MQKIINIDRKILGGTPVFSGTRVPIKNLLDYLEGGETINDFLKGFPSVTKEQVLELLKITGKIITSEKFIHENIN